LKKLDYGQTLNTLANVGVIAGIVFLAFELSQNNDFLELEANTTRVESTLAAWDHLSSDPSLVALMIKDRSDEALTEGEEMRLSAFWMGYLVRREWLYKNFPESDQKGESFLRAYAAYGSLLSTWNGNSNGSVTAGKDNFSPEFVKYTDEILTTDP
jgi:hypothetical protein